MTDKLTITTDDADHHVDPIAAPTFGDDVPPRALTDAEVLTLANHMIDVCTGPDVKFRGGTVQLARAVVRLSAQLETMEADIRAIVDNDDLTAGEVRRWLAIAIGRDPKVAP